MANSTRARSRAKDPTAQTLVEAITAAESYLVEELLASQEGPKAPAPAKKKRTAPKFPLRLHATSQWMKKINGRCFYFGTDRDKALAEYLREKDAPRGRARATSRSR